MSGIVSKYLMVSKLPVIIICDKGTLNTNMSATFTLLFFTKMHSIQNNTHTRNYMNEIRVSAWEKTKARKAEVC